MVRSRNAAQVVPFPSGILPSFLTSTCTRSPCRSSVSRRAGILGLLTSALSNQSGAAIGSLAFPVFGPLVVVAVCQFVTAAILLPVIRPRIRTFSWAQHPVADCYQSDGRVQLTGLRESSRLLGPASPAGPEQQLSALPGAVPLLSRSLARRPFPAVQACPFGLVTLWRGLPAASGSPAVPPPTRPSAPPPKTPPHSKPSATVPESASQGWGRP